MRILPILSKLTADTTPGFFKTIEAAKSISSVSDIANDCPACFVHPLNESSQASALLNAVSQGCEQYFAVIIAAQNVQADSEPLEDARDEVFAVLLGFQPSTQHDFVEHVSGEVIEVDKGVIWWRDVFKTIQLRG